MLLFSHFYFEQFLKRNTDIMAPHMVYITGTSTMKLTFESKEKYNQWKRNVDNIRSGITFILATQYPEPMICNIYNGWIPQVEYFEITWGSDFVPDDIKTSLEEAKRFLDADSTPPPNPVLLRMQRDQLEDELSTALRRQNDERKQ